MTLSPREFSFDLIQRTKNEPVVFKGLFADVPAIKKWKDPDYLTETIGAVDCPYVLTNASHFEIQRVTKKYSEVLETLIKDDGTSVYVSGDQLILATQEGLPLLEDLQFPRILGKQYVESPLYSVNDLYLFLGNKGYSGTSWHCAPNWSLFVQVKGRKKWTFIHPKYSTLLHPQRSHLYSRIFLAGEEFREFRNEEEKNSPCPNCTVSTDGELFSRVPRTQVILEPGDALTVPSWYWHHVENLKDEEGKEEEGKGRELIIGLDVDTHEWNHNWLWVFFPVL
jgi:hypothetical protein